ncbi:MAG: methionyl-tRNA formyltransferase [Lachnospiraceae bacterium]|nr:methionyl-tRNA formyltransferase [Lachnospiraceae bacterium]
MKIVFMGTPEFAGTILNALINAGHEITAVYTQPDRPKGRSGAPVPSFVGAMAAEKGIKTYKPLKIREASEVETLRTIPADIFVVAAYGQFLSEEILNMPKYGCVNVHGSLLPKYRGASSIQRAIINGDAETGVTIMKMDKGMDSGDMYVSESIPITPEDDEETMYKKLAALGAKLLVNLLPMIEAGTVKPVKQADSLVTFAPMLKKEEGYIDFSRSAREIDCLIRGLRVWPTAYTFFGGKSLKIGKARPVSDSEVNAEGKPEKGALFFNGKRLFVKTGEGFLELLEVQPESKKMMNASDFARGARIQNGDKLGL